MVAHKLKVDGMDLAHANITLDDKPIRARKLKIDMAVDSIHSATIEMETLTVPDVDIDSFITFGFTPETVEQALGVLRSVFKNDSYDTQKHVVNELEKIIDDYAY